MVRIVIVFAITAAVMLFIFHSADWYATNAALPRYCEDPQRNVEIVEEILTRKSPGADKQMRPYIVAAKLIFLVPQSESEPLTDYLARLRGRISQTCGVAF